jgi:EmrB/QacA subfamily drug resistance transporter
MGSSVNIALPSIGKEFSMNAILISWIATAYLLSAAMFILPFGRISDIYGRKKVFLYGMIVYTIASFLAGISSSSTMFICIRVLQGVGASMIVGTGVALLTAVYPLSERGKVLGINAASVYAGLFLGPFVGGFLIYHFGWRSIFLINVPLGLITIIFTTVMLKGDIAYAQGEKFDIIGTIIYSLMLLFIMYGFSIITSISGIILILIGILIFLIFIKWEINVKNPIINISLFQNNVVFKYSNLATFLNYVAAAGIGVLLSFYLQFIKGINPNNTGLILTSQPIVQTIFSPFAGKLSDKFEARIISSIGMTIIFIGLLSFSFINQNTNLLFIIMNLFIIGLGFALFSSPNTNAVMSSVDKSYYGVAAGTLATMRATGQMMSLGIIMLIFAIYIGKVKIEPIYYSALLKSIKIIFLIFSILCFLGIFFSLARGKVKQI